MIIVQTNAEQCKVKVALTLSLKRSESHRIYTFNVNTEAAAAKQWVHDIWVSRSMTFHFCDSHMCLTIHVCMMILLRAISVSFILIVVLIWFFWNFLFPFCEISMDESNYWYDRDYMCFVYWIPHSNVFVFFLVGFWKLNSFHEK